MQVQAATTQKRTRSPERTCAFCRRSAPASELVRIVRAPSGELVVDWRRNLGGRGANLCPTRRCIAGAVGKRSLDRVLKAPVSYPDPERLLAMTRETLSRNMATLLCSSNGARALATGGDQARAAISEGRARAVLLARNSSSSASIEELARRAGIGVGKLQSKEQLGAMLERRPTGVVAVVEDGLAKALLRVVERLEALE